MHTQLTCDFVMTAIPHIDFLRDEINQSKDELLSLYNRGSQALIPDQHTEIAKKILSTFVPLFDNADEIVSKKQKSKESRMIPGYVGDKVAFLIPTPKEVVLPIAVSRQLLLKITKPTGKETPEKSIRACFSTVEGFFIWRFDLDSENPTETIFLQAVQNQESIQWFFYSGNETKIQLTKSEYHKGKKSQLNSVLSYAHDHATG